MVRIHDDFMLSFFEKMMPFVKNVTTPLWAKCEGEAHIPESGKLESSGTPENSECDCKGSNLLAFERSWCHWIGLEV